MYFLIPDFGQLSEYETDDLAYFLDFSGNQLTARGVIIAVSLNTSAGQLSKLQRLPTPPRWTEQSLHCAFSGRNHFGEPFDLFEILKLF